MYFLGQLRQYRKPVRTYRRPSDLGDYLWWFYPHSTQLLWFLSLQIYVYFPMLFQVWLYWVRFNPQMPKVKIHLGRPRGWIPPPGFLPSRPNFVKIFIMGMFSGPSNPTVIMKQFYLYCMILKIEVKHLFAWPLLSSSGCKHDTKLILVSILTFSRSWISNMLKTIMWPWRLTLKLKVTHIHCMTFLISGYIQATDSILVSILTFARLRISENQKSVTWPW